MPREGRGPDPRQPAARAVIGRAAADPQVRAWWHMQQVGSERLGMSDHSWVHIQIVANIALRMLRLADRAGISRRWSPTTG